LTAPARLAPGAVVVVPATPDRWDDVVTVLGGSSDKGCWCQAPRGFDVGPLRTERRELLRAQLADDIPAGMLAYVDGEVAGWCGFGVRGSLPRLDHSRTIPALDELPVWAILCLNIRVGYRRRGVARALVEGVIDYARQRGAPGVEAYPVDPEGGRVNTSFGFVGFTPMFERLGFRRVLVTDAHSDRRPRWLMRLDLRPAAAGRG
jgi:GNAT superfamily N-acetyltransferase